MKDEKICKTCKKLFSWRKKWQRDWENVLYCSERCRKNKLKLLNDKQNNKQKT